MKLYHCKNVVFYGLKIWKDNGFKVFWQQLTRYVCARGGLVGYAKQVVSGKDTTANFVSYADLARLTSEWCETLRQDFDYVCGIPRGGLFPASIIAMRFSKPLTTPDSLISGKYWISKEMTDKVRGNRVLLVDDTVYSGNSINKSKALLESKGYSVIIGAPIIFPQVKNEVAEYYKIYHHPVLFEWEMADNIGAYKTKIAMDMDGVICRDCPLEVDIDDKRYAEWLQSVSPLFIPAYPIDAIVTNRLAKYRPQTEQWLARYDVKYNKIYFWDKESKTTRGNFDNWISHKVEALKEIKPDIYYESDRQQAIAIHEKTDIPVLVWNNKEILQ